MNLPPPRRACSRILLALLGLVWTAGLAAEWHVAPAGSDTAAGTRAQPFATLERARDAIRELKRTTGLPAGGVTVWVHGGTHHLSAPLILTPEDSGTDVAPIEYRGEATRPLLSAGRPITGWRELEPGLWAADVPAARGGWRFEQLWVNGSRATPARSPNTGYFHVDLRGGMGVDPATGRAGDLSGRSFRALRPEHLAGLAGLDAAALREVQLTMLWHNWISTRLRVQAVDAAAQSIVLTGSPGASPHAEFSRGTRYFLSGYRAALDAPGEWFLDPAGLLLYRPRPGEDMTSAEVVAPHLEQFLVLSGDPAAGRYVEHLRFRGLRWQHAECRTPPEGMPEKQGAATVPAAIHGDGARAVVFEDCEVAHVGGYGLYFRHGCREVVVRRCHLYDLGAGGVQLGGHTRNEVPSEAEHSSHFTVEDNIIRAGGRVFPSGVAILSHHCSDSQFTHNRISDFYYTGISVGWVWNYGPSRAQRNRIAGNHLSHLGQGVLSDLAGIYTLGRSSGTEIAGNLIHHISCYNYGGYGIYNDQGSAGLRVYGNVIHDTDTAGYMMNWGKDVVVENNVFAFTGRYAIHKGTGPEFSAFDFTRNIVVADGGEVLGGHVLQEPEFRFTRNLYWQPTGRKPTFLGLGFAQWQAQGKDRGALVADPLFADVAARDFRPRANGPAARIGFEPLDLSTVGVRGDAAWRELARRLPAPPPPQITPVPELTPLVLNEDFETTPVSRPPITPGSISPTWAWEDYGLRVSATDESAAVGRRSLCLVEEKSGLPSWAPMLVYRPWHLRGTTRLSFYARVVRDGELAVLFEDRSGKDRTLHGPRVAVRRDRITLLNRPSVPIPEGSWVHVEITVALGAESDGTFDVVFRLADGSRHEVRQVGYRSREWNRLDWLAFSSAADGSSLAYLDAIQLVNLPAR